jgi:asparagine synthase (glutamine-hydrolysing)
MLAAFVGRFTPQSPQSDLAGLARALGAEADVLTAGRGPLALAASGPVAIADAGVAVCLLDGRPRVAGLAGSLGLDPTAGAAHVVAAGFARLGPDVLGHLGGEYALAVWDPAARSGLIARDRLGAVPLFVTERGRALLFSAEIAPLLALLPRRPDPDALAVVDWLAATQARDDRTLFAGISRLPAGHALLLEPTGWRRIRHWRPRYAPTRSVTPDEAAALLAAGIQAAVTRALDGAQRPGLMLSGGFDSATVAVSAVGHPAGRTLRTYSGLFPGAPAADESERIRRVRSWLGLDGVEARFSAGSALGGALEFLDRWQVPSASPNVFLWLALHRRAAADGVDVMLDGEGGDELLGCAPYLIADRLLAGHPVGALALARRLPGLGDDPRPKWLLRAVGRYGLRGALAYRPHRLLRRTRERPAPDWLNASSVRLHRGRDDPWAWKRGGRPRWWWHLADVLSTQGDRLGAAEQYRREGAMAGLEFRHPLRDPELVELVLGLPPELAFDPRQDRALARRAMRDRMPDALLAGDGKAVFNDLLTTTLRERDSTAISELLREPHPELARRVREAGVARLVRAGQNGAVARTWALELWRLVSIELWLDQQHRPERLERMRELICPDADVAFVTNRPVNRL